MKTILQYRTIIIALVIIISVFFVGRCSKESFDITQWNKKKKELISKYDSAIQVYKEKSVKESELRKQAEKREKITQLELQREREKYDSLDRARKTEVARVRALKDSSALYVESVMNEEYKKANPDSSIAIVEPVTIDKKVGIFYLESYVNQKAFVKLEESFNKRIALLKHQGEIKDERIASYKRDSANHRQEVKNLILKTEVYKQDAVMKGKEGKAFKKQRNIAIGVGLAEAILLFLSLK